MSFEIKKATRTGVKALIAFHGAPGGGKTRSALLLARGLAGQSGGITLIDTENGRGSIFADKIPGGYSTMEFTEPFSPDRFTEAITVAEQTSDVILVDSLSHEWSGDGGILDWQEDELQRMAGNDFSKREACKMAAWIKPKMGHKKFIQRLLRSKSSIIVCFRGEEKTHIEKEGGKTKVYKDKFTTPIFDPRFMFEALICAECYADDDGKGGLLSIRKITHEDLYACLPGQNERVEIRHGEALARWCAAPGGSATQSAPKAKPDANSGTQATVETDLGTLKKELWTLTQRIHKGDKHTLAQWLWDEMCMGDSETLETVTAVRLQSVLEKVKTKL